MLPMDSCLIVCETERRQTNLIRSVLSAENILTEEDETIQHAIIVMQNSLRKAEEEDIRLPSATMLLLNNQLARTTSCRYT